MLELKMLTVLYYLYKNPRLFGWIPKKFAFINFLSILVIFKDAVRQWDINFDNSF